MSINYLTLALLLLFALASLLYLKKRSRYQDSTIHTPTLALFPKKGVKEQFLSYLPGLFYLGLIFSAIAFLDPHTFKERKERWDHPKAQDPKEGRQLFLVVDQSGSMKEAVQGGRTQSVESKLGLVKAALQDFIKQRPDDMMGLVAFARSAQILDPPTLDHEALLNSLKNLNIIQGENEDGTAIGYAIFKTATLMASLKEQVEKLGDKAPYTIQGQGIILLTDGLQDPNPLDQDNPTRSMELLQAAQFAKSKGIRVYVINVEPRLNTEQYLPNLNEMKRIAQMTGGAFYMIEKPADIKSLLGQINELETSTIRQSFNLQELPSQYEKISYAFPFLLLGFACLAAWLFLKLSFLRSFP